MKDEYDFSQAERGKFYRPNVVFSFPIYLGEDVDDLWVGSVEQTSVKISRIIWLRQYVVKLEVKHHVYRDEVRQVLFGAPLIKKVGRGKREQGEDLYAAYGQTDEGRYLVIFFIHKPGNEALIISARDMDDKERKRYGRH